MKVKEAKDRRSLSLEEQSIHLAYGFAKMFPSYAYLFNNNLDDYASALTLQLLSSIDKFDESKAVFTTFAFSIFKYYIMSTKTRAKRKKRKGEEISLSDIVYEDTDTAPKISLLSYEDNAYNEFMNQELYSRICDKLIPYLSPEFIEHFRNGKTYDKIALEKGVSKQAVNEKVLKDQRFMQEYIKTRKIHTNNQRYHKLAKALDEVISMLEIKNLFSSD